MYDHICLCKRDINDIPEWHNLLTNDLVTDSQALFRIQFDVEILTFELMVGSSEGDAFGIALVQFWPIWQYSILDFLGVHLVLDGLVAVERDSNIWIELLLFFGKLILYICRLPVHKFQVIVPNLRQIHLHI